MYKYGNFRNKSITEHIWDLALGKELLVVTPKAQSTNGKIKDYIISP